MAMTIAALSACSVTVSEPERQPQIGPGSAELVIADTTGRVIIVSASWKPNIDSWMLVRSDSDVPVWRPIKVVEESSQPWTPMELADPQASVLSWTLDAIVNERGQVMIIMRYDATYVLSILADGTIAWRRLAGEDTPARADDPTALSPGGFGIQGMWHINAPS